MNNLLIKHHGALGDHGYTLPCLQALRKRYDGICLYIRGETCKQVYENTGLVDKFLVYDRQLERMSLPDREAWFACQMADFPLERPANDPSYRCYMDFHGIVPGRYMFHVTDPLFEKPISWAKANAKGVSFYDVFSEYAGVLEEARGKRPFVVMSDSERRWLAGFRQQYNISESDFLLGWQFGGSSANKWYPFAQRVMESLISRHKVKVVATGDDDCKELTWWRSLDGRYINLAGKISFRQAFLLTSIYNCFVSPETGVYIMSNAFADVPKVLLATHTAGYHIAFEETKIIQSDARCSPCYKLVFTCIMGESGKHVKCVEQIPPHRVIDAIERIISRWRKTNANNAIRIVSPNSALGKRVLAVRV